MAALSEDEFALLVKRAASIGSETITPGVTWELSMLWRAIEFLSERIDNGGS